MESLCQTKQFFNIEKNLNTKLIGQFQQVFHWLYFYFCLFYFMLPFLTRSWRPWRRWRLWRVWRFRFKWFKWIQTISFEYKWSWNSSNSMAPNCNYWSVKSWLSTLYFFLSFFFVNKNQKKKKKINLADKSDQKILDSKAQLIQRAFRNYKVSILILFFFSFFGLLIFFPFFFIQLIRKWNKCQPK